MAVFLIFYVKIRLFLLTVLVNLCTERDNLNYGIYQNTNIGNFQSYHLPYGSQPPAAAAQYPRLYVIILVIICQ